MIYVGDSPMDIQAPRNAGVFSVGYLFNLERREVLEKEKLNGSSMICVRWTLW